MVVGNSNYTEANTLRNPVSDAARMQVALHRLGFNLIVGQDLTHANFSEKVREFVSASRNADVALFFYAGHGVQYGERNYLLPTDITLASQQDITSKSIALDDVLQKMTQSAKISVIFLDACRDSPEFRSVARGPTGGGASWTFKAGLAAIRAPARDHFIGFAASPGQAALDGKGRQNSPFTEALLKHIGKADEIGPMFSAVRADVLKATNNKQIALLQAGLSRPLYLNGLPAGVSEPIMDQTLEDLPPVVSLSEDTEFWFAIRDTSDPKNFDLYLERYPKGRYIVLARRKLDELLRSQRHRPPRAHSPEAAPPEDEPVTAGATALITDDHPRVEALRSAKALARAQAISMRLAAGVAPLPTVVSSSSEAADLLRYVARGVTLDEAWVEPPGSSREVRVELRARVHLFHQPRDRNISAELTSANIVADQPMRIRVGARRDAEIGMYALQADGTILRLYPAPSQAAVTIKGGESTTFPRPNDPYPAISSAPMPGERSNHEAIIIVSGARQAIAFDKIVPTPIAHTVQHGATRQLDASEFMRRLANITDTDLEVLVLPYVVRAAR